MVYICMYIYVNLHICMYMYVLIHICAYVYMNICICICICILQGFLGGEPGGGGGEYLYLCTSNASVFVLVYQ